MLGVAFFTQGQAVLSFEILQALDKVKSNYETVSKIEKITRQIEDGESPRVSPYKTKWDVLVNDYNSTAAEIRKADPLYFDISPYNFSASDMASCDKKPEVVQKMRGQRTELSNSLLRGNELLTKLDETKEIADKTYDGLRYLITVYEKLLQIPVFSDLFQFDWLDLNLSVQPALSDVSNAVTEKQRQLKRDIKTRKLELSNLEGNLASYEQKVCN